MPTPKQSREEIMTRRKTKKVPYHNESSTAFNPSTSASPSSKPILSTGAKIPTSNAPSLTVASTSIACCTCVSHVHSDEEKIEGKHTKNTSLTS